MRTASPKADSRQAKPPLITSGGFVRSIGGRPIVEVVTPFVIVPPAGGEGFVALSRSKHGEVFEKHILSYGDLIYPGVKGGKVHIDDTFAKTLIRNFDNGVAGIAQVPKADKN